MGDAISRHARASNEWICRGIPECIRARRPRHGVPPIGQFHPSSTEYAEQSLCLDPHPSKQPGIACGGGADRKSTRLNSSHLVISYAVFCLKKKKRESVQATL